MIAVVCDMCKQPLESDYDGMMQKGYRFKGSFSTIRVGLFGRKKLKKGQNNMIFVKVAITG